MPDPQDFLLRRETESAPVPLVVVPEGCELTGDLPLGAVRIDLADVSREGLERAGWRLFPAGKEASRSASHTVLNLTGLGPELRLVTEAGASSTRRLPLSLEQGERRVLGREPEVTDWALSDPAVSRRHLELRAEPGGLMAEDLGSTSGTRLNGKQLAGAQRLNNGDEIELGHSRLRFYDPRESVARFDSQVAPAGPPGAQTKDLTLRTDPTPKRSHAFELVLIAFALVGVAALLLWLGRPLLAGADAPSQGRQETSE